MTAVVVALAGVLGATFTAGTILTIAFPRRRKQVVIDLEVTEG